MRIVKVQVQNFRLLKDVTVDIEDNLSVIIGKNNSGKTSFLQALDNFINDKNFSFDDFNTDLCNRLLDKIDKNLKGEDDDEYTEFKIFLCLIIEIDEDDGIENVHMLFTDLNSDSKQLKLVFEYTLTKEKFDDLINDIKNRQTKLNKKINSQNKDTNRLKSFLEKKREKYNLDDQKIDEILADFEASQSTNNSFSREQVKRLLEKDHTAYFTTKRKPSESESNELSKEKVKKIIRLETINAWRDVANTEGAAGKTLSRLSARYYKNQDQDGIDDTDQVTALQNQLLQTDNELTTLYSDLFRPVLESIKTFSANTTLHSEGSLLIRSRLTETTLLDSNTYVTYQQGESNLPEHYNGLGYMNLFAIIFDIHIKLDKLIKEPADINLLFIEEPEAHTHPQMQYVFINNIKKLLQTMPMKFQTIITTHSPHIISQSDFSDIKYFSRVKSTELDAIHVKNMKELEVKYNNTDNFNFLKMYLTANNSELFFADKVVFIEGDSERILLPTMMRRFDRYNHPQLPLLSQNISIIQAGNYTHVFDKFLEFLEIKALIITDIDSVDTANEGKVVPVDQGDVTSNESIKHFLGKVKLLDLASLTLNDKIIPRGEAIIFTCFQTQENGYHARSFEDAFLATSGNLSFIIEHQKGFHSLKNKHLLSVNVNVYDIAKKCIDKKSAFAADILFHTNESLDNWTTPTYIQEGLEWLAK